MANTGIIEASVAEGKYDNDPCATQTLRV
jgi:hypothetical protein